MPKAVELVQILVRAFGAFWLISGGLQFALSILLVAISVKSPPGLLAACAAQMGVFSIGSIAIGATLILTSAQIARFAVKPIQLV